MKILWDLRNRAEVLIQTILNFNQPHYRGVLSHKKDERDEGYIYENERHNTDEIVLGTDIEEEFTHFKYYYDQKPFNTCVFASGVLGFSEQCKMRFSVRWAVKVARKEKLLTGNGWSYLRAMCKIATKIGFIPYDLMPDEINGMSWNEYSKWTQEDDKLLKVAEKYRVADYKWIRTRRGILSAIKNGYVPLTAGKWFSDMNYPKPPGYLLQYIGSYIGGHAYRCHPEGTKVLTKEGYKDIDLVDKEDFVLTRDSYQKVIKTMNKDVSEKIYEIGSSLGVKNLKLTAEHPVLVKKIGKQTKWEQTLDVKDFFGSLEFVEAKDLKEGYMVVSPIDNTVSKNNITKDFARLLGYYIGDGNLQITYSKNGNIKSAKFRLTYSRKNKKNLVEDLIRIVKDYDNNINYNIYEDKKSNTNIISFYSTKLAKEIMKYCGTANNKYISKDILFMEHEKQMEFIKGWFLTDGWGGWLENRCSLVSACENLVYDLAFILQRNKLSYSIRHIPAKKASFHNGEYNCREAWEICFNNKKSSHIKYKDGFAITKIKQIKQIPFKGKVYNLEIENKNEYVAENILVHNCTGWSYFGKYIEAPQSFSRSYGNDTKAWLENPFNKYNQYGIYILAKLPDEILTEEFKKKYEGWIVRTKDDVRCFYIENGKKRHIPSTDIFNDLLDKIGHNKLDKLVNQDILNKIEESDDVLHIV